MATRNIVPRADGEGELGTTLKKWFKMWMTELFVSGNITDGTNTLTVSNAKTAYTHAGTTGNPHGTTATDIGLGNVTNVAQIPSSYLDTDGTLAANSDTKVATQKAVKTYADAKDADLFIATDGVTRANTTSEGTIIGSGVGSLVLPANFFTSGKVIFFQSSGFFSTTGTPTVRMRVKLNGTTILDTGTSSMSTSGVSNRGFSLEGRIVCRTTGVTGTIIGSGKTYYSQTSTTTDVNDMVNTSTTTIDTTVTQTVDITFQWGTASASNTLTAVFTELEKS